MSTADAGFLYFVGSLFVSGAIGTLYGTAVGCMVFGGFLIVVALLSYLNISATPFQDVDKSRKGEG